MRLIVSIVLGGSVDKCKSAIVVVLQSASGALRWICWAELQSRVCCKRPIFLELRDKRCAIVKGGLLEVVEYESREMEVVPERSQFGKSNQYTRPSRLRKHSHKMQIRVSTIAAHKK